ncbi:MAG: non-canonical purine NTP pyrophosphatase [Candidatus Gracilibacteria bacterium]|jgi:XTP/dITP diphosphohydrolase
MKKENTKPSTAKNRKSNKPLLLIGTGNPGKFREIKEILHGLPLKFIMPQDLGIKDSPHESGKTYKENAKIKAKFYFEKSGGVNTLAEDSGIEIHALPNALGHQTRRWGKGEKASDTEWLTHFLKQMEKISESKRTAEFKCTTALIWNKKTYIFEGSCKGKITHRPEAPILKGLPLSSCFRPDSQKKVYAALSAHAKNKISHRGQAISKAKNLITKSLIAL